MKKILIFLIVVLSAKSSKADLLLGMCAKSDTLAIAYKKSIRFINLDSAKVLFEITPNIDTSITNSIYRKSIKFCSIPSESRNQHLKSIIDFSIVNLTFSESNLIVGIRYFIGENLNSKIQYGLLKFDKKMHFIGLCLFMSNDERIVQLPAYFPLEISKNYVILPEYDSGRIRFCEFNIDFISSKALITKVINNNPEVVNYRKINSTQKCLINPSFYSISGLKYKYYFQFPFPYLFSGNADWYNDAFNLKKYLKLDRSNVTIGDGKTILFEQQKNLDKFVLFSSNSWNDSMFYLCSTDDTARLTLIKESNKIRAYTYQNYKIITKDTYFLIQNYKIYAIKWKNGIAKIDLCRRRYDGCNCIRKHWSV
jgi:hypothetical protein